MSVWSGVLDSCPGLLCCVINIKGRLIYATHGYKAIAARLFGHKCEEGRNYPPLITTLDREIHAALTAACLGEANALEFSKLGLPTFNISAAHGSGIGALMDAVLPYLPEEVNQIEDPEMRQTLIDQFSAIKTPYTLSCTGSKSLFKPVNVTKAVLRTRSTIFVDSASGEKVTQEDVMGKAYLVKETYVPLKWTVLEETSEIEGYECKKAVLGAGEIVAWVTEDSHSFRIPKTAVGHICQHLRVS